MDGKGGAEIESRQTKSNIIKLKARVSRFVVQLVNGREKQNKDSV